MEIFEIVATSNFWYDMTKVYISPEKFLEAEDAKKVTDAINVIEEYEQTLIENDLLEDM